MAAMSSVAAYIVVGGRSSRMGRDKAHLVIGGKTLLEHALATAAQVAGSAAIAGPRQRYGAGAVEDIYPGQGPLAGIHAALTHSTAELNLILAVDTPFVTPDFLRFLVEEAERTKATVTVPFVAERYHPLCAVYRREFAQAAEKALQAGHNKIDALFCQVSVHEIKEAEFVGLAFDARMFDNLNTPEDFERAQRRQP